VDYAMLVARLEKGVCIMTSNSEIRQTTPDEVGQIAGGAMDIGIGPLKIHSENGMFSVSLDGLGSVSIWGDGALCIMGPENSNGTASGRCVQL
jgi:hypothetical protein